MLIPKLIASARRHCLVSLVCDMVQASKVINPAQKCQQTDVFSPGDRFPWFAAALQEHSPIRRPELPAVMRQG